MQFILHVSNVTSNMATYRKFEWSLVHWMRPENVELNKNATWFLKSAKLHHKKWNETENSCCSLVFTRGNRVAFLTRILKYARDFLASVSNATSFQVDLVLGFWNIVPFHWIGSFFFSYSLFLPFSLSLATICNSRTKLAIPVSSKNEIEFDYIDVKSISREKLIEFIPIGTFDMLILTLIYMVM